MTVTEYLFKSQTKMKYFIKQYYRTLNKSNTTNHSDVRYRGLIGGFVRFFLILNNSDILSNRAKVHKLGQIHF